MERRIQRRCCSLLQALSRNEDWKRDYKNATVCFTSFPYHVGSVKYEQHINTYLIRKRTLSYFWNWLQFWNFSSHCKYFCSPLIRALSEGKQQLMKLQPITEKLSNSRNQLELQVNTWKRRLAPENAIFRVTSFQDQLWSVFLPLFPPHRGGGGGGAPYLSYTDMCQSKINAMLNCSIFYFPHQIYERRTPEQLRPRDSGQRSRKIASILCVQKLSRWHQPTGNAETPH